MMTSVNAFLLSAASTLVTLGVITIRTDLIAGAIQIALGIIAFVVYEKLPVSK